MSMPTEILTFDQAQSVIDRAVQSAGEAKIAVAVSVVDTGGHLLAFARMDGVSFMAVEVTRRKAVTAAMFRLPSHALNVIANSDPAVAADLAKNADVCLIPGGVPLIKDGELLGAVGVAGGRSEQDRTIAEQALTALQSPAAIGGSSPK